MKIFNRLSSFFYSLLPWFVPGLLFLFANTLILLSGSAFEIQNSIVIMGLLSKSNIIMNLILPFLFGILINSISSFSFSHILDKQKLLKDLCEENDRVRTYQDNLCSHYEKETMDPLFVINEAKFLYESGKSERSISKSLGLYRLMRNLLIPLCYISLCLLIVAGSINRASVLFVWFVMLCSFSGICYLSVTLSKKLYKKLMEMSFFIVSDNIKE